MISRGQSKILITGASGYIGEPTTRALQRLGHDVHILGQNDPDIFGVTFHQVDLLDTVSMRAVVQEVGAEILIHLAWSVAPGRFWTDPANVDWVAASLNLFRAFANAGGVRIVGVGSCAEYEWSGSLLSETSSAISPGTLYGKAKASVWAILEAFGAQEKLSVAWARIFFLYGPGEPRGKLVADAVNTLLQGRRFATTPGLQKRDFLYIDDAAEALVKLTLSKATGAVNVASGECIPVRDLLNEVAFATDVQGLIEFGARPFSAGEPIELAADITRLRDVLGFKPRYTLAQGVELTVAWWREHIRKSEL